MKNMLLEKGGKVTLIAPYDVNAGDGFLVGSIFAVATHSALTGKPVAGRRCGAFSIKKTAAQTFAVGAKVYWDNVAKSVTSVSTSNKLIGAAIKAAAGGDATADTLLSGEVA